MLRHGHRPDGMDDKWFFFCEGAVVHLHRSWTGEEIWSLTLRSIADGSAEITGVLAHTELPKNLESARALDFFFDRILPQYRREDPQGQ